MLEASPPALKPNDRISKERYLERIGKELDKLGALNGRDEGSKSYNRILELRGKQTEVRKLLGVVA
jgi:hypothetical protein